MSSTCVTLFNPPTNPARHRDHCFPHFTWRTWGWHPIKWLGRGDAGGVQGQGLNPSLSDPEACCPSSLHSQYATPCDSHHVGRRLIVALDHVSGDVLDLYTVWELKLVLLGIQLFSHLVVAKEGGAQRSVGASKVHSSLQLAQSICWSPYSQSTAPSRSGNWYSLKPF